MRLETITPITTLSLFSLKRMLEEGIRISKNHHSEFLVVFTSQKVFQLSLIGGLRGFVAMASFKTVKSLLKPLGVVEKCKGIFLVVKRIKQDGERFVAA